MNSKLRGKGGIPSAPTRAATHWYKQLSSLFKVGHPNIWWTASDGAPLIKHQNTVLRRAIPPGERLALTLHFLATGYLITVIYCFTCHFNVYLHITCHNENSTHEICLPVFFIYTYVRIQCDTMQAHAFLSRVKIEVELWFIDCLHISTKNSN